MYELTYAERLRGRRFWAPLIALLAATVVALMWQQELGEAAPNSTVGSTFSSDNLDPTLGRIVASLGSVGLICDSPAVVSPHEVRCQFGEVADRVVFRSYSTRRAVLHATRAVERATAASASPEASYLINGKQWTATGTWSAVGNYDDVTSIPATVAQQVSEQLAGCLELLPRERGSCDY